MDNVLLELRTRSCVGGLSPTVDNVRRTCDKAASLLGNPVLIDKDRLRAFVHDLDVEAVKQSSHLMDVSLPFKSVHAELNFHLNLHLFNFGHGFRHPLHTFCGRGAWQTMKRGIETLHTACGDRGIDAAALAGLTEASVDSFFGFPDSEDAADLRPLRDMVLLVARSTGNRLVELGFSSFADMIVAHSSRTVLSSSELVELLATTFPAFNDRRSLGDGGEVLFLKKAQIAVAEVYQKLGDALEGLLDFNDVTTFTVACDNVLPCVLKTLGILRLNADLEERIAEGQMLPAGREEALLRASALSAAEEIVRLCKGTFWSKELGDFLWTLGKEPEFRKVERHATRDTCFY